MSLWIPPDISGVCAEAQAPLTECSQTGYMFLALVAQLFGRSTETCPRHSFGCQETNSYFDYGFTSPAVETSILGPTLGSPLNQPLGPVLDRAPFEGSYSSPVFSFYMKKHNEPAVSYNTNHIRRTSGPDARKFKAYEDVEAADSKVTPATENKKAKRRSRHRRQAEEVYDFIIVGAGSAGCVLANRLSEVKKWKILLLEAGPEEPDVTSVPAFAPVLRRSSIDWMYNTQPEELTCRAQRGQTCSWLRGKTMGGSSAINYMVYMRGNKKDYDFWEELGNHGWSYKEVLPYFKKAENNRDMEVKDKFFHAAGGPLNVERFPYYDINTLMLVRAFTETGLPLTDFNGAHQIGTDIGQATSIDGKRLSVNHAYISPIRHKRPNLRIVTEAYVTKILIDPLTKVAHGVSFFKNGLEYSVQAKKEVIVSAGTINSPKLLMLSGIGPKYHLEELNIPVLSDLKVGYNLMDHVTTDAFIVGFTNRTSTLVNSEQLMSSVYDYYEQPPAKHGPLSSTTTLSAIAFMNTKFSETPEDLPDIQFHFDGRNLADFYSDPPINIASNIFPLSFYDGLAVRPLLLVPKSRGYITLNHTDPVFGPPLIYSRFFTDERDLTTLIASMRYALTLENTEAFRSSGARFIREPVRPCDRFPWGTDEYFSCLLTAYTSTIYHPAGTCKMGPYWDRDAVVDPKLKVYGIHSLRVIDASIMPQIIRGNLNAPTIMIAEKVADIIKKEHLSFHKI